MEKSGADRLLSMYLLWGIISLTAFIAFVVLLSIAVLRESTDMLLLFITLVTGFLWIGVTSICRHVFVLLKGHIGKKISILEFLSTQFIVLLFPIFYSKLRKEVQMYRENKSE